jgi:ABC-type Mn2+/Zn2+ transport systems, permease components
VPGASAALLLETNIVAGSIVGSPLAAGAIGVLGARARDRNSAIGILMPFGLGLGVLFLALCNGRAANKFGLLTGQIVTVDTPQMAWLLGTSAVVLAAPVVMWRPLTFASADPDVAAARGVPVRGLTFVFMLVPGLAVACPCKSSARCWSDWPAATAPDGGAPGGQPRNPPE